MMQYILTLAGIAWSTGLLAILIYGIVQFVVSYRQSKNTGLQRLWDGALGSATLLWLRFVFLVGALLDFLAEGADFLGAPGVSSVIQQYGDPKIVAIIMIVIAVVGEFARRRKGAPRQLNDPPKIFSS